MAFKLRDLVVFSALVVASSDTGLPGHGLPCPPPLSHTPAPSRLSERMIQVQCEVGNDAVEAFVDTGAQVTVMSLECARRCGFESLIDQRYAGTAVGVGSARIVGKIVGVPIRINSLVIPTSLTILEDMDLDMLLGMDFLRQGQCEICLRENILRFHTVSGAHEVSFGQEPRKVSMVAHLCAIEDERPMRSAINVNAHDAWPHVSRDDALQDENDTHTDRTIDTLNHVRTREPKAPFPTGRQLASSRLTKGSDNDLSLAGW